MGTPAASGAADSADTQLMQPRSIALPSAESPQLAALRADFQSAASDSNPSRLNRLLGSLTNRLGFGTVKTMVGESAYQESTIADTLPLPGKTEHKARYTSIQCQNSEFVERAGERGFQMLCQATDGKNPIN